MKNKIKADAEGLVTTKSSLSEKNNHAYQVVIVSPVGKLGIKTAANNLTDIDFLTDEIENIAPTDAFTKKIVKQLESYFNNPAYAFDLPLGLHGTLFQNQVWRDLQKIPMGSTVSYSALAKQLQTGPRAIGNACRHNPVPLVIPCHRVVAVNHLGGYSGGTSGKWTAIKHWLLQHEGII